ncbi:hypothetical protein [Thiomicrospira microaerophila]|uniref:hypothetical protein n=1 Tax=Thiomicrospira microaerophila TaxID=406020 RepID=UPI0005C7F545|nr:hypothetical protein [Thiomicrospira microaerophila]
MKWLFSIAALILLVGCAQKTVVPLSPQTGFDEAPGLERHDFDQITPPLVEDMWVYPWHRDFVTQHHRLPAIYVQPIDNQTQEAIDLVAAQRSLQQALLASKQVMLVEKDSAADFVMTLRITRQLTQTDSERRSLYALRWQLSAVGQAIPVWQAENKIEKMQRIQRF